MAGGPPRAAPSPRRALPPGRLPPPPTPLHCPGISARHACSPALLWVGKLRAAFWLHSSLAAWAPSPLASFPGLGPARFCLLPLAQVPCFFPSSPLLSHFLSPGPSRPSSFSLPGVQPILSLPVSWAQSSPHPPCPWPGGSDLSVSACGPSWVLVPPAQLGVLDREPSLPPPPEDCFHTHKKDLRNELFLETTPVSLPTC